MSTKLCLFPLSFFLYLCEAVLLAVKNRNSLSVLLKSKCCF